ncbi:hypothetical protein [Rhodohalobacter mucosus]|uniref:Uncharacterized protein n=1 Tax=Rhodohalobacter mucosus TaxID=2079485 RepID=A0A316TWD1_9BACT|nr:hypothetical protein [Rhodohalobacter mucosus]PWN06854.1 hypothetical protein DDZ15_06150 [Rhodohalobacter mucosus]
MADCPALDQSAFFNIWAFETGAAYYAIHYAKASQAKGLQGSRYKVPRRLGAANSTQQVQGEI